jgi:integrase
MSIFKRGRTYWFHFWFDGRHVQRSTKQGNPRVARQIEAAYRTQLARGEVGIYETKGIPIFSEAMRNFLAWSKQEHESHPRTHRRYVTSSIALQRHFGSFRLDAITPETVERFKGLRASQKSRKTGRLLRPASVNRELACGKAMYNFAIKADIPLRNPFSRVNFLAEQNEQTRVLSYEEERAYLAAASQPLRDIAVLMVETGMRPEEVYTIRGENLRMGDAYLINPHGKTKAAKRKIALTTRALAVLKRRLAGAKGDCVFPHQKDPDRPMLKVNSAHKGALGRSGVAPFRLYDLRHTWATRAAMSGIDLVTLAAMLGHSRIQMVLRYAHPSQQHQADAMRRLEEFNRVRQLAEYEEKQQALATHLATEVKPPGLRKVVSPRKEWRRGSESNRRIKVLQTSPLPLGYRARLGRNSASAC